MLGRRNQCISPPSIRVLFKKNILMGESSLTTFRRNHHEGMAGVCPSRAVLSHLRCLHRVLPSLDADERGGVGAHGAGRGGCGSHLFHSRHDYWMVREKGGSEVRARKPLWKSVRVPTPPPTKFHSSRRGKRDYNRKRDKALLRKEEQ